LREQVLSQKVGNRTGISAKNRSGSVQQRPARRERGTSSDSLGGRLRLLLGYIPLFLKIAAAITMGLLLFAGYKAAASARFFRLRSVEVQGTARASVDAVQAIVRRDVAATGVWQADLKEINAHLQQLAWVRTAIVTRVLPDGVRVRIAERIPRAVVRLSSGRFVWVDDDGVLLGEMQPTDEMPPFFLRGWNEDDSESARGENRERVRKYQELRRLWDGGLSDRVSEVNLIDLRDVRAQLAGDDSQIEVRLGSQDLGKRLKQALEVLDEQRKTARGAFISYVDLTQGRRAIVGFVSGAHTVADGNETAAIAGDTKSVVSTARANKKDAKDSDKDKKLADARKNRNRQNTR
jgi:cell division protein FtsQ